MAEVTLLDELKRLEEEGDTLKIVQTLSRAIQIKPDDPALFLLRSQSLLKLEKYRESASDALKACDLGAGVDAYSILGRAYFSLHKYADAKDSFEKAKAIRGPPKGFDDVSQWIEWCAEKIKKMPPHPSPDPQKIENEGQKNAASTKCVEMPVSKIKHDWYQTDSYVIVTILIKNLKKEDINVMFQKNMLSVSIKLTSGSEYILDLDLYQSVSPENSFYKIFSSKVEIKMKKLFGGRWDKLENEDTIPAVISDADASSMTARPSYPTSSSKKVDWDKLETQVSKDEEDEKLKGEDSLNKLFQKIYCEGSDEVRKAMNKSFVESGGTVLSTNWNEVAKEKIDIKPPDGMEWKEWEK